MAIPKAFVPDTNVQLKTGQLRYVKIPLRHEDMEEVNACPYYRYGIIVAPSGKPLTRRKEGCEHPESKYRYALSDSDKIPCGGHFEKCVIPREVLEVIY